MKVHPIQYSTPRGTNTTTQLRCGERRTISTCFFSDAAQRSPSSSYCCVTAHPGKPSPATGVTTPTHVPEQKISDMPADLRSRTLMIRPRDHTYAVLPDRSLTFSNRTCAATEFVRHSYWPSIVHLLERGLAHYSGTSSWPPLTRPLRTHHMANFICSIA